MNKRDKVLTYDQARELKWFCRNVAGVRNDMYDTIDKVTAFDERIKRLEKTCGLIEEFLGEKIEPFKTLFDIEQSLENPASGSLGASDDPVSDSEEKTNG